MKLIITESMNAQPVWTEEDWPALPRQGETVIFKGHDLEVLDVDHDFNEREIRVWVRVPPGVTL